MRTLILNCQTCKNDFQHPASQRGRKPHHCPDCRQSKTEHKHTGSTADGMCRVCAKTFTYEVKRCKPPTICPSCRPVKTETPKPDNECERCHEHYPRNKGPHQARLCPACKQEDSEAKQAEKKARKRGEHTGDDFDKPLTGEERAAQLDLMLRSRGTHISLYRV